MCVCVCVSVVNLFILEHSKHLKQDVSEASQDFLKGVLSVFQGCFKDI